MAKTAKIAKTIFGDQTYQERARRALPILVRQAIAGNPIYYSALAAELEMPNPRNLNFVLGSIGHTIEEHNLKHGENVPPIQSLVINKSEGLPGTGIGPFLEDEKDYAKLSIMQQREIVNASLQRVYSYPQWLRFLEKCGLQYEVSDFYDFNSKASKIQGSGESPFHKALKDFVAKYPKILDLPESTGPGDKEAPLPSGDVLDVSFRRSKIWVAAEVKSIRSPESDLLRGIYQCIKYKAVMEAVLISESKPTNVRVVLVVEEPLPDVLRELVHTLNVEVLVHRVNSDP